MIVSINPTDGRELARYELHSDGYVDQVLNAAANAQRTRRKVPVAERCDLLRAMARTLRAGKARYAAMITREMGNRSSKRRQRSKNAPTTAISTRRMRPNISPMKPLPRTQRTA